MYRVCAVKSDCLDTEHVGSKILRNVRIYLPIDMAPYTEDSNLHRHRYENLISRMSRSMLCVRSESGFHTLCRRTSGCKSSSTVKFLLLRKWDIVFL